MSSDLKLDEVQASVAHCVDGWRIKGGGLDINEADDVTHLEALSGLRGIDGQDSAGVSLRISSNAVLTSLAGLRNLKDTLPGALGVVLLHRAGPFFSSAICTYPAPCPSTNFTGILSRAVPTSLLLLPRL